MEAAVKSYSGAAAAAPGTTQNSSVVIRNLKQSHNEAEGVNSVTKNTEGYLPCSGRFKTQGCSSNHCGKKTG